MLQKTLQMIIQRLAFPDWFQHGDPSYEDDEQHVAFMEFRKSLTKIFKRIFLIDEDLGFMFIQAYGTSRPMQPSVAESYICTSSI